MGLIRTMIWTETLTEQKIGTQKLADGSEKKSRSWTSHQCFTHLTNAGYKRNKKSQNVCNFLMGNLKQIWGTQGKEYLEESKHYSTKSPVEWTTSPCLCTRSELAHNCFQSLDTPCTLLSPWISGAPSPFTSQNPTHQPIPWPCYLLVLPVYPTLCHKGPWGRHCVLTFLCWPSAYSSCTNRWFSIWFWVMITNRRGNHSSH